MEDHHDEAALALLNPLLRELEMLTFVARHLHRPDFEDLMGSIGAPDEDLKSAKASLTQGAGRASQISSCPAARNVDPRSASNLDPSIS